MNSRSKETDTLRAKVYWWLERPDRSARGPWLLEIALVVLISLNVVAVILETVASVFEAWQKAFLVFEAVSLAIFIIEYFARLWAAPEDSGVTSRWAWALRPIAIIDLMAILPALLFFLAPVDLRVVRAFRMLRLLKLTRYSAALNMLLAVFEEEAGSFLACLFILVVMLVIAASGAWIAEHQAQPDAFGSILSAMWWAVATLTTVGYGDVAPITVWGKIFGALITIVGIGMAALPAGIIASGLNTQIQIRRDSLKQEFRKALEDGNLCAEDEAQIEALRKELGLSRRIADSIREQVHAPPRTSKTYCSQCGQELPR